ncbi:hypothetical protein CVD25_17450 [Bacillus canaveralius]|uniref:Uncharacterized protein n=1 Tax=Bacillus canaveralius TaxID=1403243 RepID=A0A2N5GQ30_9BACI|nr:hypothetical protein [Bacillus canaveralius]PLR84990.1 hypothetical protein CU635_05040 [Bacillus canaveralius]PLR93251.1 hypothetical protein CVD25_17450 [Bacillus canaveralius]RSK52451.1 hypothetical protein EJA13_10940 [Bacillus canaveralius]
MAKNEAGNTLITVLLVSLVFTILGLSIVAASIGGSKRVETRESDLNLTYGSVKVIEKMVADVAASTDMIELDRDHIGDIDNELQKELLKLIKKYEDEPFIDCLTIIDVSRSPANNLNPSCPAMAALDSHFAIETDKDFTRAYEMILTTKNPAETEGEVARTLRKRIILSPLPSFLKYAVGSDADGKDKGLFLNGSANIVGNVYANELLIDKEANYQNRDQTWSRQSTPLTSINGDFYSSTANLLPLIKPENFYKKAEPELKHDSQFVNIHFDHTFTDRTNEMLKNSSLQARRTAEGSAFTDDLRAVIKNFQILTTNIADDGKVEKVEKQSNPLSLLGESIEPLEESYRIEAREKPLVFKEDIKMSGDVVVISANAPVTFEGKLVVSGDLYLVSYKDLILLDDVYVAGDIHIINLDGRLAAEKMIVSSDSITIESSAENSKDIDAKGVTLNGDMISGKDLCVKAVDTAIQFNNNIVVNNAIRISGDETDKGGEDDEVVFDSVIYGGDTAHLSNVNILGAEDNKKHLILFVKNELLITRMNEFNNFKNTRESAPPYLPGEDKDIQPLKAFFYTDNKAELYGVGSLFYINGGIFAREKLEINAVRGKVKSIERLRFTDQDGHLSRFIVDYNQDVLLERIDALPIVEKLQIFSDELIID